MLRDLFSLFPAYAGVIPWIRLLSTLPFAFPRICGGDPYDLTLGNYVHNFSPHMRG